MQWRFKPQRFTHYIPISFSIINGGRGDHLGEVDEVLEAGVEVGLLRQSADVFEVGVVHVRVHPEEPLEDGPDHLLEVVREGRAVLLREDLWVVQLRTPPA